MERVLQLTDPHNQSDAAATLVAARYVQELEMHVWASDLNRNEGVAPRTNAVLAKCASHRARCEVGEQPPQRGDMSSDASRVWAARWRTRWGGVHGRLRVRDEPPLAEMRAKVFVSSPHMWAPPSTTGLQTVPPPRHGFYNSVVPRIQNAVPEPRPLGGTQTCPPFYVLKYNPNRRARFTGPNLIADCGHVFGPRFGNQEPQTR